jgi:hypothetical protein
MNFAAPFEQADKLKQPILQRCSWQPFSSKTHFFLLKKQLLIFNNLQPLLQVVSLN